VRIIARRTLRQYVERRADYRDQPALKAALDAWFDEVHRALWTSTADVERHYATASIVSGERIVFNIKGNDYRLVVAVDFEKSIVCVKWIGTHGEYDQIDVAEGSMNDEVKPIRSEADYQIALDEVEILWGSKLGTPEGDRLDVLATLINAYEAQHDPMDPLDPIDAIKFRMEQQGLTRRDLEGIIGTRTRISEVLSRKRGLSIDMIRRLHDQLGISAEVLIRPTTKGAA
jgi:HTH-type transcriptional regulator/antitoxin HigA